MMRYLLFLAILFLNITSCEEDSDFLGYLGDANTNTMGGCTDPVACNYGEPQSNNGKYCDYSCFGCNDPAAFNYSPDFSENNDGCLYLSTCDKTYVPDNRFEAFLERETWGPGNPNNTHGDLITNNNYVYTEHLNHERLDFVSWHPNTSGVANFEGIKDFNNLKQLAIMGNSLVSSLNLKNGLNSQLSLTISQCPNLGCVEVDDSTWSANNWINIDSQIYFSEDCQ